MSWHFWVTLKQVIFYLWIPPPNYVVFFPKQSKALFEHSMAIFTHASKEGLEGTLKLQSKFTYLFR